MLILDAMMEQVGIDRNDQCYFLISHSKDFDNSNLLETASV